MIGPAHRWRPAAAASTCALLAPLAVACADRAPPPNWPDPPPPLLAEPIGQEEARDDVSEGASGTDGAGRAELVPNSDDDAGEDPHEHPDDDADDDAASEPSAASSDGSDRDTEPEPPDTRR